MDALLFIYFFFSLFVSGEHIFTACLGALIFLFLFLFFLCREQISAACTKALLFIFFLFFFPAARSEALPEIAHSSVTP
jgi:hypothetical protein